MTSNAPAQTISAPSSAPSISSETAPASSDPQSDLKAAFAKALGYLAGYKLLIHGFTKVGKTTTAASFPNPTFITFERGHRFVRPAPRIVELWPDASGWDALRHLNLGQPAPGVLETVIVDSVTGMWEACASFVCRENKGRGGEKPASHIGEIGDKGKGWDLGKAELAAMCNALIRQCQNRILIFIGHSRLAEVDRIVLKHQRVETDLVKTAFGVFDKLCDSIWYLGYNVNLEATAMKSGQQAKAITTTTSDRVLWCAGSDTLQAGNRESGWPDHFDRFDGRRGFQTLATYIATHLENFGLR